MTAGVRGGCLLPVVLALWAATTVLTDYGPTSLSQEEKDAFLDTHNDLRAQLSPAAANMKYMAWDESLASMAQAWSDTCHWGHGQPEPNTSPFTGHIGQNMYVIYPGVAEDRPNASLVTEAWYGEVAHYSYLTNGCADGEICGHYTQLAWASSYAIGCGVTLCETATGISASITDLWIITCDYGPGGNVIGEKPYISGIPCTKCDTGSGECYDNQCRPCSEHQEECVCAQICENCGVLNTASCSCLCPGGFGASDCSIVCEDYNEYCSNGYPLDWCAGGEHHDYMLSNCPATCGLCNPVQEPDFQCNAPITGPTTTITADSASIVPSHSSAPATEAPPTAQTTACQGAQCEQSDVTAGPGTTQGPGTSPAATPTACPQLACRNAGSFDSDTCRCRCTDQYQGPLCQHNREQAASGVVVTLVADINLWDVIAPTLKTIIAEALTSYCNDNFELCCPNRGPKNGSETLPYANESHVQVADGYPEPEVDAEGAFTVMFLVTGLEGAELCAEGGTAPARRRRDVAIPMDTGGLYVDQSILLQVIQESTANMTQGLADQGIVLTVATVEAGEVEPTSDPAGAGAATTPSDATPAPATPARPSPPAPDPPASFSGGAIAGIVLGSVAVLGGALGGALFFFVKASSTSTIVRPFKE